ncbi:phasin family protein [Methylobacterium sp. 77]|uniref:phasin family protein n=1 Tax=Methylobacterium sp. 77 TaxID=1101192 RepID=UPI0003779958|nr:phasin family protein [Methylobacterium sp. 77]
MSIQPFDKIPGFDKAGIDSMMKSVSLVAKTNQTAGTEMADFAKQSFEHGTATMKKLAEAKTPQNAMEIQAEFMKASYERLVAQAKLVGTLYSELAKEMAKPLEEMTKAKFPTVG